MNQCPYCKKNIESKIKYCTECGRPLPLWNRFADRFGSSIPDLFTFVSGLFGEKHRKIGNVFGMIAVVAYMIIVIAVVLFIVAVVITVVEEIL